MLEHSSTEFYVWNPTGIEYIEDFSTIQKIKLAFTTFYPYIHQQNVVKRHLEIFDTFNVSGSSDMKFSAGMYKHEDIKQESGHQIFLITENFPYYVFTN